MLVELHTARSTEGGPSYDLVRGLGDGSSDKALDSSGPRQLSDWGGRMDRPASYGRRAGTGGVSTRTAERVEVLFGQGRRSHRAIASTASSRATPASEVGGCSTSPADDATSRAWVRSRVRVPGSVLAGWS